MAASAVMKKAAAAHTGCADLGRSPMYHGVFTTAPCCQVRIASDRSPAVHHHAARAGGSGRVAAARRSSLSDDRRRTVKSVAECRDCGRDLGGQDGFFESCVDHDLRCIVPAPAPIELADVAIVALHWAGKRILRSAITGSLEDGASEGMGGRGA